MELRSLLDTLRLDTTFMSNVAAWQRLPPRPPRHADFPENLDRPIVELVHKLGLSPLYAHQAQAIEMALNGENVVLVTGTASGKSLAYHLPSLQICLREPAANILYLFPTKALAQDQEAALKKMIDMLDGGAAIRVAIYDGDTPSAQRARIRKAGGIVISNPDMLHVGILPYHTQWADFFRHLKLVVLDELHTYRGIFGSHMANVLRRLRRICQFYGSNPRFVCASATIANPLGLAGRLLEAPVALVDQDGSPSGEKHIILYNPPTLDERLGVRRSYTLETASLAGQFLSHQIQTIVFARARLTTEVLLGYLRDTLQTQGLDPALVRGYRGGYLPLERRDIEKGLRQGDIRGVVATNALELGIDIGTLSAAILAGYPGTIASTWQQLGRAGRRNDLSVGILVGSGAPLDQYIMTHPAYVFERSPEHALIDPDNLNIVVNHLRCAAFELPFERGEHFGTFQDVDSVLGVLAEEGEIHESNGVFRWMAGSYPAGSVSLRTSGSHRVVIQARADEQVEVIGEIDRESAPTMVYQGAAYIHEGRQYVIEALDWENGIATAKQAELDYYTTAASSSSIQIEEEFETETVGDCVKTLGRVIVTTQAGSYRMIKRYTHETLGYGEIDLPAQEFETTAYWVSLTPDLTTQLEEANILLRPNDYGPNWPQQRDKARARDGYRCTRCGAPERENRQHDVHHLRPFREFGYVPGQNEAYLEANRLENLTTLCSNCHRAVEASTGTRSALGGLSHAVHNIATLLLMCSANDIGVLAEQRSTHTKMPTITIFDRAPGGLGFSLKLYELHADLLKGAMELVRDCPCAEGCPACVGPSGEVGGETKNLTQALLDAMLTGVQ